MPVTALKGVGTRNAERLEKIGVQTVQDVLFHLPFRYQDRTRVTPIGALRLGDQAVVEGVVEGSEIRFGRRRSLLVALTEGNASLTLRFFHFSAAQKTMLAPGVRLRCFGEVRNGPKSLEMVHPEYRRVDGETEQVMEESLTPIYPTTEGIHQLSWRGMTEKALSVLAEHPQGLPDLLPEALLRSHGLPELAAAVRYLHRPPPDASLDELAEGRHPAQRRLAFEELLAHQLSLRELRRLHKGTPARVLVGGGDLRKRLMVSLPFKLTAAQERVVGEIGEDLRGKHPMMRLVQGDVGSGKTIVSALAVLQALESNCQAALMAPTELLAEQHWSNFCAWFEPLQITMEWLSGRVKGGKRTAALERIAAGEAALIIGTHALFQQDVAFSRLGLVIVDEQHRFGVHQRLALTEKHAASHGRPHQLVMTATPIPRTLSMVAYADLDCSIIDELPPGRRAVTTVLVDSCRREEVVARVAAACQQGRQAYWVCTLIEDSDALQAQAAEATAQELRQALPELAIGLIHGRQKPADKEATMAAFKAGELSLLVATTVIEVGVDVPNASLMIIENPERLGLAQLHQLRGRVGRGSELSHCVLLYQAPLSGNSRQRLSALRESSDGFYIAEKDLELRGPGEVLGTRQTGLMEFRIAELPAHNHLLDEVQAISENIRQHHPLLATPLIARWTGASARFAKV